MKISPKSRRRWPFLVAAILAEPIAMKLRGYRLGGHLVVRCRRGHLFTTLWLPGLSLKSLRFAWWRFQRCPAGKHWSIVTPDKDSDLSDDEKRIASEGMFRSPDASTSPGGSRRGLRRGWPMRARGQLLIYHFMFEPDWDEGCPVLLIPDRQHRAVSPASVPATPNVMPSPNVAIQYRGFGEASAAAVEMSLAGKPPSSRSSLMRVTNWAA